MKRTCQSIGIFIALFLVCSGTQGLTEVKNNDNLNQTLFPFQVQFKNAEDLDVIRNFSYGSKEKSFHTIIAQNEHFRVEIEITKPINEDDSKKFIESKYIIITSLYEPQKIPYTGALTRISDCAPEYKPVEHSLKIMGKPVKVLIAKATNRFVLGACDDSLIKQKEAFTMVYDQRSSTLYQIAVFQPIHKFNQDNVFEFLTSFH